jgi:3-isopropylmalate dehydratase small subunit
VHRRNLVNEGVPTLVVTDDAFFELAAENAALSVDLNTARITHVESGRVFRGEGLSGIAADILAQGGIINSIMRQGQEVLT